MLCLHCKRIYFKIRFKNTVSRPVHTKSEMKAKRITDDRPIHTRNKMKKHNKSQLTGLFMSRVKQKSTLVIHMQNITHLIVHHGRGLTFELGAGQTEPVNLVSHTYLHIF